MLDPKRTTRKGAPRKNHKKWPLETSVKRNKAQSKSTLFKSSLKKDKEKDEDFTQASQVSSFPVLIGYLKDNKCSIDTSVLLIFCHPPTQGTHYPIWPTSYIMNIMPLFGIDQQIVAYFPPAGEGQEDGASHRQ